MSKLFSFVNEDWVHNSYKAITEDSFSAWHKHLAQRYIQIALYGFSSTLQKKTCTSFTGQKRIYASWHKFPASAPLLAAVSILPSSQPPVCWTLEAIMHCITRVICSLNHIHVIFIYTTEHSLSQETLVSFALEGWW